MPKANLKPSTRSAGRRARQVRLPCVILEVPGKHTAFLSTDHAIDLMGHQVRAYWKALPERGPGNSFIQLQIVRQMVAHVMKILMLCGRGMAGPTAFPGGKNASELYYISLTCLAVEITMKATPTGRLRISKNPSWFWGDIGRQAFSTYFVPWLNPAGRPGVSASGKVSGPLDLWVQGKHDITIVQQFIDARIQGKPDIAAITLQRLRAGTFFPVDVEAEQPIAQKPAEDAMADAPEPEQAGDEVAMDEYNPFAELNAGMLYSTVLLVKDELIELAKLTRDPSASMAVVNHKLEVIATQLEWASN